MAPSDYEFDTPGLEEEGGQGRGIKNMIQYNTITTYLSKIILNVNGLNALIKRHRVVEWIRK